MITGKTHKGRLARILKTLTSFFFQLDLSPLCYLLTPQQIRRSPVLTKILKWNISLENEPFRQISLALLKSEIGARRRQKEFRFHPVRIAQTKGRLRERAKRDESDSGDGSGNVSGPGLDPTGSGHSSRRVQGLWLARPIESDSRQI